MSLGALNRRVAEDLAFLNLPSARWMPDRTVDGQPLLDVAIVGGGMAGLAAAAAIRNAGMGVVGFDARPEGEEGPWATTARMRTLRSPKQLTGPAIGIPSLTFRAWFEAQFGRAEWDALDKIPRLMWMDYLRWYRTVLDLDIRNGHRVTLIRLAADHVALEIETPAGAQAVRARRAVLATGRDGLGGPTVPDLARDLPREVWAHSADRNDYDALRGKRVAVIGGAASSMDSAGTALEAGAASVDLLIRREEVPRINRGKGMGNPGMVAGFRHLPDEWRWRIQGYLAAQQTPPPRGSVQRVAAFPNARFWQGCALVSARMEGREVVLDTTRGTMRFDFVIFATGFRVDWAQKPFLAEIADCALTWGERAQRAGDPRPEGWEPGLAAMPVLGPAFQFTPKEPGACPGLERVHALVYPAVMSHGAVSGDIPAISDGALRLADGLAGLFYVEDIATHFRRGQEYAEPEIFGDEWTPVPREVMAQG